MIILANVSNFVPDALAYKIADLYIGDELELEKTGGSMDIASDRGGMDLDPAIFDKFIGRYEVAPNYILNVFREHGKMMIQMTGQSALEIFAESEKRFFLTTVDAQIEFGFNEDGSVKGMVLFQNGRVVPGRRMEDLKLSLEEKNEYTGRYYSDELDAIYKVYLEDDQILVRVGYNKPMHMIPSREDVFEAGYTFKFERNDQGNINGLVIEAGRVRRLKFKKMS